MIGQPRLTTFSTAAITSSASLLLLRDEKARDVCESARARRRSRGVKRQTLAHRDGTLHANEGVLAGPGIRLHRLPRDMTSTKVISAPICTTERTAAWSSRLGLSHQNTNNAQLLRLSRLEPFQNCPELFRAGRLCGDAGRSLCVARAAGTEVNEPTTASPARPLPEMRRYEPVCDTRGCQIQPSICAPRVFTRKEAPQVHNMPCLLRKGTASAWPLLAGALQLCCAAGEHAMPRRAAQHLSSAPSDRNPRVQ